MMRLRTLASLRTASRASRHKRRADSYSTLPELPYEGGGRRVRGDGGGSAI
jgi:hypothetical protein